MARAHPIRIELTEDMSEIVESVLESGEFQSADEVVSAALNAFQVRRLLANFTPDELDALIQEGIDSGEPIDGEESFRRLRDQFEREFGTKAG
ncbi:ribbon-helix-helix domain-containing protein [Allorhizobium pseudoryzae]|jgi:antitoxin ParD1/3/4|uniref:ribbon-helix-helix domain-containing protein n=1 Tax=Allorhizobium pseudoryzae TaxID=379684 RepID=UPI0013EB9196|nr:type II toxin-antitoxin system ParD family antitoxin [Allorhizobium pseudoryzae]